MPSLFLTEYIKSNMFIQNLREELADRDVNFDLIVSDINYVDCPILCINPNNKPENISLIDAWKDAINVSKHPLIILNELNSNKYPYMIMKLWKENFAWNEWFRLGL